MRKKIHLHIGMHKTGTSAIQKFCSHQWQTLRDMGILYPAAGRPKIQGVSTGHHLLPWSISGHVSDQDYWPPEVESHDQIWTILLREIQNSECEQILLSSEEFDTLKEDQVANIKEKLAHHDVMPICYLRRLDDFFEAMYATDVVYNSEVATPEEYLNKIRTPLSFVALLSPWMQHFDRVSIGFYSPELPSGEGIVNEFLASHLKLGALHSTTAVERVNVGGWPWHVTEACRQMNKCGVPTASIIQFAETMRVVASHQPYDSILPSTRLQLISRTQEGLQELTKMGVVQSVPKALLAKLNSYRLPSDAEWIASHQPGSFAISKSIRELFDYVVPNRER